MYLNDLVEVTRLMESLAAWVDQYSMNDVYPSAIFVQVKNANGYRLGEIKYEDEQFQFEEDYQEDEPA